MSSTESSIMAKERIKGNGKGIKIVRDRYNDLNHLIGDLSAKLSEVSSSIDQEFLSAYRVHMVDVQEDLKTLKQQVRLLMIPNLALTNVSNEQGNKYRGTQFCPECCYFDIQLKLVPNHRLFSCELRSK
jgi:hypothetical protein